MRSTRQNIIFEASFEQAREALISPEIFPWLESSSSSIFRLLSGMGTWSFAHVKESRNIPATLIAGSVTKDNHTQSYVSRGGPCWLQRVLDEEKRHG